MPALNVLIQINISDENSRRAFRWRNWMSWPLRWLHCRVCGFARTDGDRRQSPNYVRRFEVARQMKTAAFAAGLKRATLTLIPYLWV